MVSFYDGEPASLDDAQNAVRTVWACVQDCVQPQWNEKHHFQVLQSELPTSMLVQCFHSHLLGEEFIGMVSVDLQVPKCL